MKNLDLNDKVVIISGASQGLGAYLVKAFCSSNARVVAFSRNFDLLKKTLSSEISKYHSKLLLLQADITSMKDIDNVYDKTIAKFGTADILINNAGVYGPMGKFENIDFNSWIEAIEINLIGSARMIRKAIPIFKQNNFGRIIQLSGGGATNPLPFITSYASSKAAIVRLVESIALEVYDYNITINSIAPGPMNTSMHAQVLKAGESLVGEEFYNKALKQEKEGGSSMVYAAELALYLCTSKAIKINGKLISALWDNYKLWPANEKFNSNKDLYTLRRIVGKDKGFIEGDK